MFAFVNTTILVYKNVSTFSEIKFELVANPIIYSFADTIIQKVFVLSSDVPAIEDIDGDGDLDILTFSIIQGNVEYYKNFSQELYHNSDSLIFKLVDDCWGKFEEGMGDNHITLNVIPTDCYVIDHIKHIISKTNDNNSLITHYRHAGSTFMANDMDNDGDVDIVLGDVGYPGLILLSNGKKDFSHIRDTIITYDTDFPKGTKQVNIRQMPEAFYMDLDNDSIKDMLVSPMEMVSPYDINLLSDTIDGLHQIWLYKNLGTDHNPKFKFIKDDFLQDEMIDFGGPTQPVFFDYDHDGDEDLFVVTMGNATETQHKHDRIVLFENTGSKNKAEFKFRNNDYMGLSAKGYQYLTLAFGDIDGDKKADMILGKMDGTLSYFKNITTGADTARFQFVTDNLANIKVGHYGFSTPYVYDLDSNNYGDLFIGSDLGEISYYSNTGINNVPDFKLITSTFGGIYFKGDRHFTSPVITDLNGKPALVFTHDYLNSRYSMVVGDIGFVEDIDGDTSHKYQPVYNRIKDSFSGQLVTRHPGKLLRPAFADLDGDGIPDMMLGSARGGLMLLTTKPDTINVGLDEQSKRENYSIPVYPNPAHNMLNINLNGYKGYFHLELYDLTGKTVLNKIMRSGTLFQLDISALPPGFYVVCLKDLHSEYIFFKKVIIQ